MIGLPSSCRSPSKRSGDDEHDDESLGHDFSATFNPIDALGLDKILKWVENFHNYPPRNHPRSVSDPDNSTHPVGPGDQNNKTITWWNVIEWFRKLECQWNNKVLDNSARLVKRATYAHSVDFGDYGLPVNLTIPSWNITIPIRWNFTGDLPKVPHPINRTSPNLTRETLSGPDSQAWISNFEKPTPPPKNDMVYSNIPLVQNKPKLSQRSTITFELLPNGTLVPAKVQLLVPGEWPKDHESNPGDFADVGPEKQWPEIKIIDSTRESLKRELTPAEIAKVVSAVDHSLALLENNVERAGDDDDDNGDDWFSRGLKDFLEKELLAKEMAD
jgi:hypothetical protein